MKTKFYDEFEHYLNSIRDAEFTSLVQQIEKPAWSIYHLDLDNIHIQYGCEHSGHIASGTIRNDGWVFFLMLKGISAKANGIDLAESSAFIIPPGQSFHISIQKPHEWLSIFIPTELLLDKQKANPPKAFEKSQVIDLDPKNLKLFIRQLRNYYSNKNSVAIVHKVKSQLLIDLIIKLANNLIFSPISKKSSSGRKILDRNNIITAALSVIHSTKIAAINIKQLKEVTNTSERTLRLVFHEFFGISPSKYILLVRLHKVKDMILDPNNSNKTIAFFSASVGFSDPGRFASRYQSLFGELPRQALTRAKTMKLREAKNTLSSPPLSKKEIKPS